MAAKCGWTASRSFVHSFVQRTKRKKRRRKLENTFFLSFCFVFILSILCIFYSSFSPSSPTNTRCTLAKSGSNLPPLPLPSPWLPARQGTPKDVREDDPFLISSAYGSYCYDSPPRKAPAKFRWRPSRHRYIILLSLSSSFRSLRFVTFVSSFAHLSIGSALVPASRSQKVIHTCNSSKGYSLRSISFRRNRSAHVINSRSSRILSLINQKTAERLIKASDQSTVVMIKRRYSCQLIRIYESVLIYQYCNAMFISSCKLNHQNSLLKRGN